MSKNILYDAIIIGSGPSGVHATYPLIEAGLKVAIIDGGLHGKFDSVCEKTNQNLKVISNIKINQSLAKGGMSEVWPGICDYFSKEELKKTGLPFFEIRKNYKEISELISLNSRPLLGLHENLVLKTNKKIYRLPISFPYRTSSVIENFRNYKNFTYITNQLVTSIREDTTGLEVCTVSIKNKQNSIYKTRFVIMAAGSINTTRILLKSFNLYNLKVPFLTKKYYAYVCLNLKSFVNKIKPEKLPGQVAISNNEFFIQFYQSNPNSIHKIIPSLPFIKLFSKAIQLFTPYLCIADIRFPTSFGNEKFIRLKNQGQEDFLEISFKYKKNELKKHKKMLQRIKIQLIKMSLLPLKIIKGDVTSHYANGIPNQIKPGTLSSNSNGKLHQSKRIYIADASTWKFLPAKPPTLTIMANARRVGKNVLEKFKNV